MSALIFDRTQADADRAAYLIGKIQRGETLTESEQAEYFAGLKGCYNITDMNRVEAKVRELAEVLRSYGYSVGYTVPLKGSSRVPVGYTEVEWIQSSGSQYIDTGYVITSENMRVVIKFAYTAAHSDATLFGSETTGITGSGEYSICPYGNPQFFVGGSKGLKSAYEPSLNEVCTLDITANNGTLTDIWNGTRQNSQSYTQSLNHTYSVAVFGNNVSGAVTQKVSMKLYSFQIYDGNVLVRDYIPCKNPAGTIGLYDLVNSAFYTNAGSGTFTAGADIVGFTAGAEVGKAEDREWQRTDTMRESDVLLYLANIAALRGAIKLPPDIPPIPTIDRWIDWIAANDIERIVFELDRMIYGIVPLFRRCGTFRAGKNAQHLLLAKGVN